jgi:hypothetical protein
LEEHLRLKAFHSMFSGRPISGKIPEKNRMEQDSSQDFLRRLLFIPQTLPLIFGLGLPANISLRTAHTHTCAYLISYS